MCSEKMCSEKKNKQDVSQEEYIDSETLDIEQHQEDKAVCCKTLAEIQDKYAHLMADFQNFRQRVEKERMQWSIMAQIELIKKILPIVDNFDRALQESAKSETDNQEIVGFTMIHKDLLKMMTAIGVEPMVDFSSFDPQKHEAIMQVDSPDHASDQIVAVLEKGYLFKGNVVRPAKVSVAR